MWSVVLDVRPEVSEMIPLAVIEPPLVSEVLQGSRSIRELPNSMQLTQGEKEVLEERTNLAICRLRATLDEVLDGLFLVG